MQRISLETAIADAEARAREQDREVRGWAQYLDRYSWDAFASLTFAQPRSPDGARRQFERWIRRVEQRVQDRVDWFLVVESSPAGVVHVHALCGARSRPDAREFQEAWTFGRAEVEAYDPGRGARFYLSRKIPTERVLHYDVSRGLDALRMKFQAQDLCAACVRTPPIEQDCTD